MSGTPSAVRTLGPQVYCAACGRQIDARAEICVGCGVRPAAARPPAPDVGLRHDGLSPLAWDVLASGAKVVAFGYVAVVIAGGLVAARDAAFGDFLPLLAGVLILSVPGIGLWSLARAAAEGNPAWTRTGLVIAWAIIGVGTVGLGLIPLPIVYAARRLTRARG